MSETPLRSMMCVYGSDIILVYVCIKLGREGVWRKMTNTLKLGHLFLYRETS